MPEYIPGSLEPPKWNSCGLFLWNEIHKEHILAVVLVLFCSSFETPCDSMWSLLSKPLETALKPQTIVKQV
jgi:hypothetical protein